MRTTSTSVALLLLFNVHLSASRLLHLLPEDPYALPKFRITYLNDLPLLNETAQRWLKDGLRGGQREFLEQSWDEGVTLPSRKEITSGEDPAHSKPSHLGYHSLEHMRLGPTASYLCLIPLPVELRPAAPEESQPDVNPVQSWSLLQPLSGTCLYHRQGWFTYSYCHNEEIRQFRELAHTHPHPPGGHIPEEDPEWEAYTLGRAPPAPEPGVDLTRAQQNALAANLELARGAGSRYLVQRWTDGTLCDKTGKGREVEVQFHCSPTMTDNVLFVKEAKTCSYVLVIQTPRLCGQPGFKSELEAATIQCREIVDAIPPPEQHQNTLAQAALIESDFPLKAIPRQRKSAVHNVAAGSAADSAATPGDEKLASATQRGKYDAVLRALEVLIGGEVVDGAGMPVQFVIEQVNEDGDVLVELDVEEVLPIDDGDRKEPQTGFKLNENAIAEALRAAGYEIRGQKPNSKENSNAKRPPKSKENGEDEDVPK